MSAHWWRDDRGETPMLVMFGLAVLAVLALSAGPALANLTRQSSVNSNDRRTDKVLALELDNARRAPWSDLTPGGPVTAPVELNGQAVPVTTWITPDPASATRVIVTKAMPKFATTAQCDLADPATLPADCLVMSAIVTAPAEARPLPTPTEVTFADPTVRDGAVTFAPGDRVMTVTVTEPLRLAVTAQGTGPVTFELTAGGLTRAAFTLDAPAGTWLIGNAVLCPSWSRGQVDIVVTGAPAELAHMQVVTAPAPASCQ